MNSDQVSKIIEKIIEEIRKNLKLNIYQEMTWILLKPILDLNYDNENFNNLIVELYVLNFENAYEIDRSNNLQKNENNAQLYNEFLRNSVDMLKSNVNASRIVLRYSNSLKDTFEVLVYLTVMSEFLLKQKLSKLSAAFHDIEFLKTMRIKYRQRSISNKNEFCRNLETVLFTTLYFVDLHNLDSDIFSCDELVRDFHLVITYLKLFLGNYCDNRFHWLWSSHVTFLEKRVLAENLQKYSDYVNEMIVSNTVHSINEIRTESIQNVVEDVLKNINFNQNSIDDLIYSVNFLSFLLKDHMSLCADILLSYWIKWYDLSNSNIRMDLIVFYVHCANFGLEAMQFTKQKSNELLQLAKKLLKLNQNVFQVLSRKILTNLIADFVECDRKQLETNENITSSFLNSFMAILDGFQVKVEEIFINSELSKDFVQIRPYDEFNDRYKFEHVWGYLLLVDSILEILRLSPNNLRLKYIEQLKKIDFFPRFLYSVFYLMPEDLLNLDNYRIRKEKIEALFIQKPDIKVNDLYRNDLSENFACWLYCQSLIGCGASVREWWIDCSNQKVKNLIEKITIACCSSFVFKKETNVITDHENHLDNVDIKVSAVTREITSTYTFEDLKMDLIIKLPHNYPLGNCQVELSQKIDGDKKAKNSIKQLVMFLSYRNGNIYEAIQMWKMNLDKKLSGIDECYICFSVAHVSSYELPKMCCTNCHKKFHSLCLYKWFSTSNNSTCPICRSHF